MGLPDGRYVPRPQLQFEILQNPCSLGVVVVPSQHLQIELLQTLPKDDVEELEIVMLGGLNLPNLSEGDLHLAVIGLADGVTNQGCVLVWSEASRAEEDGSIEHELA